MKESEVARRETRSYSRTPVAQAMHSTQDAFLRCVSLSGLTSRLRPDERLSESQIAISSNLEGRSGIIEVPSKAAVGGEFSQERNLRLEDPTTVRRVKSLTCNVVKYDDGFKGNVHRNGKRSFKRVCI